MHENIHLKNFTRSYTGWPRKNATPTITNFNENKDYIELVSAFMRRKFLFKQNDTKTNDFL